MSFTNIFGSQDGETRTSYGYTFRMTPNHLTPEDLAPMKHTYDTLGERALHILDKISPPSASSGLPKSNLDAGKSSQVPERDMYALLRDNADKDDVLKELWDEINTVPDWVDWEQINRGQEVFYRYAAPAIAGFAFQGLFGSTVSILEIPLELKRLLNCIIQGASYRPAETLVRTGGHSVKVARHRFFETFQLLLQVAQSLEGIKPGGAGFITTVRVRFLHATVRSRILNLAKQRPSYFDTEKYGVPINDADMIQSLCAFSVNVLFMGLRSQGIYVRQQEAADYIALWRWVGYIIGGPTWCLETPEKAIAAMQYIRIEAFHPSDNGRVLVNNIVKALEGVPPAYASKQYWETGSRWMNGDKLCDELGLGKPGLYHQALMAGQCWIFIVICYTCRSIPYLDRRKIAVGYSCLSTVPTLILI